MLLGGIGEGLARRLLCFWALVGYIAGVGIRLACQAPHALAPPSACARGPWRTACVIRPGHESPLIGHREQAPWTKKQVASTCLWLCLRCLSLCQSPPSSSAVEVPGSTPHGHARPWVLAQSSPTATTASAGHTPHLDAAPPLPPRPTHASTSHRGARACEVVLRILEARGEDKGLAQ